MEENKKSPLEVQIKKMNTVRRQIYMNQNLNCLGENFG